MKRLEPAFDFTNFIARLQLRLAPPTGPPCSGLFRPKKGDSKSETLLFVNDLFIPKKGNSK
jgi:hypothetical protein